MSGYMKLGIAWAVWLLLLLPAITFASWPEWSKRRPRRAWLKQTSVQENKETGK